ncbi:MAG TPA: hypothetical protein VHR66_02110 [Gemmataceae bacterium]|jgi:hypothetical protein|nr:hypothetical protein [Gemmataceae bacterium]
MPRQRSRYDDDDRRGGRRRTRDDEPIDSPKSARKKRISPVLILGAAAGAFVLLLAAGITIYLIARNAGKPASADLLAYVPADATMVAGYDLDELSSSEAYRTALERQPLPDVIGMDRSGFRQADLSRFVVARLPANGSACVVRFKTAPEKSKYLGPDQPGKKYGPFTSLTTVYRFGYFADASTLVLADTEQTIQALRDQGSKVQLASELKEMTDRARGPVWRATGRTTQGEPGFPVRAGATSGSVIWLEPSGSFADVKMELRFGSTGEARNGSTTLRGLLAQQRGLATEFGGFRTGNDPSDWADIRRGYDESQVVENGTRLTARLRLPASEALRLAALGAN